MPKVSFTENNVKKNDYDYPKIKLEKGEIARIVLLEDPEAEFVHNIRKPKLNGGVPEMETKTRFKDGSQYEDYKYEFVSRPICLGDYATLEKDGSDPKRCPVCAEALRSDKFSAPQRRFALHVVRYETHPGKTEVKEPFQATTVIWSFTDRVFNKLFEFKQEWGDLRQRDLILKCENKAFQTYDISVAAKAAWMEDEKRQELIRGLMAKENLAPDLSLFCGSRKSETQIGYDIQAVNEVWAIINGSTTLNATDSALTSVGSTASLTSGIDDLLSATPKAADDDVPAWSTHPAGDAELAEAKASEEAPKESTDTVDLDALLKGI